jgi:hypothetical protein
VRHLRFVLAGAAGAIVGLLAYGLAPSFQILWGLGAAAAAIAGVFLLSILMMRDEDRDPTIRPPNVPYGGNRGPRGR